MMHERLGENLQFYRMKNNLTQEQLAEHLDVSRQSISKWESGAVFPEMDKLLQMCDLFSCPLDTLLRGDAKKACADDTKGYDRQQNRFALLMSLGCGLLFLSSSVLLVLLALDVKTVLAVVFMLAFVIAGIMVMICAGLGHEAYVKKHPFIQPFYSEEKIDCASRRFRVAMTFFIGLMFGSALFIVGSYALDVPQNMTRLIYWAIFALILTVSIVGLQVSGMLHDKYDIATYNKNNTPKDSRS